MTTQEQAEQHQAEVVALTAVAALAVRDWFASLETAGITTLALLRLALMDMLPRLTVSFGSAAATVAADWYEEVRAASGVGGSFVPRLPDAPPIERINALAGWATIPPAWLRDALEQADSGSVGPGGQPSPLAGGPSDLLVSDVRSPGASPTGSTDLRIPLPDVTITPERIREARGFSGTPLREDDPFTVASDFTWAQERIIAGVQRVVSDQSRDTIIGSSLTDRKVIGWQRMSGGPGDCAFCQMLIARRFVYTKASVKFGAHDHCDCVAAPVFEDETVGAPVKVDDYTATNRKITDADRKRVRDWIKANQ